DDLVGERGGDRRGGWVADGDLQGQLLALHRGLRENVGDVDRPGDGQRRRLEDAGAADLEEHREVGPAGRAAAPGAAVKPAGRVVEEIADRLSRFVGLLQGVVTVLDRDDQLVDPWLDGGGNVSVPGGGRRGVAAAELAVDEGRRQQRRGREAQDERAVLQL